MQGGKSVERVETRSGSDRPQARACIRWTTAPEMEADLRRRRDLHDWKRGADAHGDGPGEARDLRSPLERRSAATWNCPETGQHELHL